MKLIKSLLLTIVTFSLSCGYLKAEEEKVDFGALFAQQNEFLEVDDAFVQQVDVFDDEIIVKFEIADEYYMYRSRFAFKAEGATLGDAYIPRGKKKVDEYLGDVEVYYHNLEISVPFTAHQEAFTFIYEFQGCAEAGLCYPPEEKTITLYADKIVPNAGIENSSIETKVAEVAVDEYVPEEKQVENFLSGKSLLEIVIYFVLLGIGLAFTPCVLPMVPILSSIIVGQGENLSRGKAFGLSLTYTQAMAIPYTLMGVFFGAAGESLSNTLQEPLFIGIAAAVFVLLSLAMFGFYELQLPQSWQNKLNNISRNQETGSYIGAGIMGILSALVVSPCVTAPLAGILIYIGQTGNEVTGGVALYSLAVGMGIPLIIVGVGGKEFLPKSGAWMNAIKAGFGVAMLGMALYISKHLIPGSLYLFAWAALLIITSIYMGAFSKVETNAKKFWKGIGLVMFIYGMTLVIGAAMGNK
ncbi:MAG: protein-disulfide reductase DsbD, partial [Gammaproteobacteria bacterium]|nr:protein-disulfide reductase DsbD [Gammaproteobacteria bacterium]